MADAAKVCAKRRSKRVSLASFLLHGKRQLYVNISTAKDRTRSSCLLEHVKLFYRCWKYGGRIVRFLEANIQCAADIGWEDSLDREDWENLCFPALLSCPSCMSYCISPLLEFFVEKVFMYTGSRQGKPRGQLFQTPRLSGRDVSGPIQ